MILGIVAQASTGVSNPGGFGTHRYWRLYHPLGPIASNYMGYGEIELMDNGGVDLTSPADAAMRASASSFQTTGTEGKQAFDDSVTAGGSPPYHWWQANYTTGSWIGWDFGAGNEKEINRVRVYTNLDADGVSRTLDCAWVQYSNDNSTWTTAWKFNGHRNSFGWIDFSASDGRLIDIETTSDTIFGTNETHRWHIPAARLVPMNVFTLSFLPGSSAFVINKMRVGIRDPAQNAYSFKTSPAPVSVTFGGLSSLSAPANTLLTSDEITLPVADGDDLLIAYYGSNGGRLNFGRNRGFLSAVRGGDDYATQLAISYSGYSIHPFRKLDVIA